MVEHPMFDSVAFNSLSHTATRVLFSIMRCKNGRNGTAQDPIVCPYSFMNGNMSHATISKCLSELSQKGFIEIVSYGGLMKQTNKYVLTGDWINWGEKQSSSSETEQHRCKK